MEIMYNYADLLNELEIIEEQLRYTNKELENWCPDGKFGEKFGINASIIQMDKKIDSLNKLEYRKGIIEHQKERIEMLMNRFDGLKYKIAYYRIVEKMSHQEIAEELDYSEQYIRRLWMEICNK